MPVLYNLPFIRPSQEWREAFRFFIICQRQGCHTAIKLAAHPDVGVGFSPRPDTHRSLKATPTGFNLMAVQGLPWLK